MLEELQLEHRGRWLKRYGNDAPDIAAMAAFKGLRNLAHRVVLSRRLPVLGFDYHADVKERIGDCCLYIHSFCWSSGLRPPTAKDPVGKHLEVEDALCELAIAFAAMLQSARDGTGRQEAADYAFLAVRGFAAVCCIDVLEAMGSCLRKV